MTANNNLIQVGTIFITGITASGKTTLGRRLKKDLIKSKIDNVKLLDGEDIRKQFAKQGKHYGYSTDERNKVALEIAHIALEYNREGIICILCSICHLKETRKQIRAIIGNVMEVYLDCPVSVCAQRDYKGHYAKALRGLYDNFIGITDPYQKSDRVELILNTASSSIKECSRLLLKSVISFLKDGERKTEQHIDYAKDFIELDR